MPVTGAVALVVLLVAHRVASLLRFQPALRSLLDHPVRILAAHGELHRRQLRRCGLTDDDVYAHLRENGVYDLAEVRYLLYETKGGLTIVRATGDTRTADEPPLLQAGLDASRH